MNSNRVMWGWKKKRVAYFFGRGLNKDGATTECPLRSRNKIDFWKRQERGFKRRKKGKGPSREGQGFSEDGAVHSCT